jgi:hypothetical protein
VRDVGLSLPSVYDGKPDRCLSKCARQLEPGAFGLVANKKSATLDLPEDVQRFDKWPPES